MLELQLKEAKQAAEVEKINTEVRENIYSGLLKVLHAKGDKGYLRVEMGDDGVELLLSPDQILKTHATAAKAAADNYVRVMTRTSLESNSNRSDNGHQPARHLENRNTPTISNPMARDGMNDSPQKATSLACAYHFHHPLGVLAFKLYDQVVQPDGKTVHLYSGWYNMVQTLITTWEQGNLHQPSSPTKPETAGNYRGIIFPLAEQARKVDPALYGGSDEEDLLLCLLTFCSTESCSLGRFCCFRHEPLSADEIRWMLFKKGKDFLEIYMLSYTAGGLPEMTGIPSSPYKASVDQPVVFATPVPPNPALLPLPTSARVRATSETPMEIKGVMHCGKVITGAHASKGLKVIVAPNQGGLPSPAITPTATTTQPTAGQTFYQTLNKPENLGTSASTAASTVPTNNPGSTISGIPTTSMVSANGNRITIEGSAAPCAQMIAPKAPAPAPAPKTSRKASPQLTMMENEHIAAKTMASLPKPKDIAPEIPGPMGPRRRRALHLLHHVSRTRHPWQP